MARPIYSTSGAWVALLEGNLIYDTRGEWIGWLEGRDVYTRDGEWAGFFSADERILRERVRKQRPLRPVPPASPTIRPPATVPLPPMFADLPWNLVDVFDEEPGVFQLVSELRPDME